MQILRSPSSTETWAIYCAIVEACEEAAEQFHKVLQLEPDDAATYANLTKTFAALHRSSDAIATAQHALDLARTQGQKELAQQIEDWLKQYRAQQANQ